MLSVLSCIRLTLNVTNKSGIRPTIKPDFMNTDVSC
jgi:hypothetical protein